MALSKPISAEELRTLLSKEQNQERWTELGSNFWIKLVISQRDKIIKCAMYQCATLDLVYTNLLKMLVGKSYGKIHKYFSDISLLVKLDLDFKNLKILASNVKYCEIFKQLFGTTFTEIPPWWLERCFHLHRLMCKILFDIFNDRNYVFICSVPCAWAHCQSPWPFEVFLRSRWGEELLNIVGCEKTDVLWWTEKLNGLVTLPSRRKFIGDLFEDYSLPTECCSWLRRYCQTFYQADYPDENLAVQCFHQALATVGAPNLDNMEVVPKLLLWDLLGLSFPTMWARKFYHGVAESTENFSHTLNLNRGVWISTWLNFSGLDFMVVLQEIQQEFLAEGVSHKEDGLSWTDRVLAYRKTLEYLHSMPSKPDVHHNEHSATFLTEPKLLVQLPMYHNLLQLWLAAALLEVTRFEIASMELRHWPVPEKMIPMVIKLLSAVRKCKESLLLGLALLCRDVTTFPKVHTKYRAMLMDNAIMPAVHMLHTIVCNDAFILLGELKRAAWGRNNNIGLPTKCVPAGVYAIHPVFADIFYNHFFHIAYWMNAPVQIPYPRADYDFPLMIARVNRKIDEKCSDFHQQGLSIEEFFCESKLTKVKPRGDPRELVKNICQEILSEAPTTEGMKSAEQHALRAIKVAEFAPKLHDRESSSLLHHVVRLSGEALVREQEVRVVAACAHASGHSMILHDLPPDYPPDVVLNPNPNMLEVVRIRTQKFGRYWLHCEIMGDPEIPPDLYPEKLPNPFTSDTQPPYSAILEKNSQITQYRWYTDFTAFEANKEYVMALDPYTCFYIPACLVIYGRPAASNAIVHCIHFTLRQFYYHMDMLPENIVDICRAPKSAELEPDNVMTRARVLCAKKILDTDLMGFYTLASLGLTNFQEHVTIIKIFLLASLEFLQREDKNKTNYKYNKLEILLWKSWLYLYKQFTLQSFYFSHNLGLSQHKKMSNPHTLLDLCMVREEIAFGCTEMMIWCKILKMEHILPYKIIARMQPTLMDHSLQLMSYKICQPGIKCCEEQLGAKEAEKYKCPRGFKKEMYDMFVNLALAIVDIKRQLSLDKFYEFGKYNLIESNKHRLVFDSRFDLAVTKHLNLKLPTPDKSRAIMNDLAKRFLILSVDTPPPCTTKPTATSSAKVEKSAVPPTTVEVCHGCKKQAEADRNFFVFSGKFFCSVQCKDSVQKDIAGSSRQWCRFCKKKEKPGQQFEVCAACVEDENYPDPNYYCSEQCNKAWWEKEHHAEHLEFELGLGRWYVPPEESPSTVEYEY